MITADENPFTIEEAHFVNAKFYQKKKRDGLQPREELEASKAAQPSHPSKDEEVIEALKGLTLPLTHAKKVPSTMLKGFVIPVQGPKIEHGTINSKAYDLLVKAGYDPTKDAAMDKLPPKVTESKVNGMNES
ncbi:hypothetical protein LIER_36967 [Lithospermum erythrorhizon]|uniref:Uncharacterized protein n=1 Tax=Lithospermum erythrorhizon TaxID=34254 RepID=A0AAV3PHL7_LITER